MADKQEPTTPRQSKFPPPPPPQPDRTLITYIDRAQGPKAKRRKP